MTGIAAKDTNTLSNVEIRLKLQALDTVVAALVEKATRDSARDERFAAIEADLRWMKWFVLAQLAATIGMLFKLFAG